MSNNKLIYNDKEYTSIQQACRELGLNPSTIKDRINKQGMSFKEAIEFKSNRKIPVTYNGVAYDTVKELCNNHGFNYDTVMRGVRSGLTIEQAINRLETINSSKPITINGVSYSSIAQAVRSLGIPLPTVRYRIDKSGMSIYDALTKPVHEQKYTYQGKSYYTLKELCDDLNISYTQISERMRKGMSLEEAISKPVSDTTVVIKDQTYKSVLEASRKLNISRRKAENYSKGIFAPKTAFEKDGIVYESIKDYCTRNKLNYTTIISRINTLKVSLDEALEINTGYESRRKPDPGLSKKYGIILNEQTRVLKRIWDSFNYRCQNNTIKNYRYAGRGISVYPDWDSSKLGYLGFVNFYNWVTSESGIGFRPNGVSENGRSLWSIDRINVNGNYEPGNIRWSTNDDQANNMSTNIIVIVNGTPYQSLKIATSSLQLEYDKVRNYYRYSDLSYEEILNALDPEEGYFYKGEIVSFSKLAELLKMSEFSLLASYYNDLIIPSLEEDKTTIVDNEQYLSLSKF